MEQHAEAAESSVLYSDWAPDVNMDGTDMTGCWCGTKDVTIKCLPCSKSPLTVLFICLCPTEKGKKMHMKKRQNSSYVKTTPDLLFKKKWTKKWKFFFCQYVFAFWLNMRRIEFIHEDPHMHKSMAKLISSRFYATAQMIGTYTYQSFTLSVQLPFI